MGHPRLRLPVGVQVNQVTRLFSAPCQGKWSLAVETALPAIGEGLFVLLTPDPKQILQNYLRPKGSRAGGRFLEQISRRRKQVATARNVRMFAGGFPDVDEMIGDALPGRKIFAGLKMTTASKWLWTGIEISDTIGFYWLLLDVAKNGLITWSSNLFHSAICHPNSAFAGSANRFYTGIGIIPSWPNPLVPWIHNEINCEFGFDGRFAPIDNVPQKGFYANCISLFFGQGFASIGPWELRLFNGVTEVFNGIDGSQEVLDVFEIGNIQCAGHFETDVTWDSGQLTMAHGDGTGFANLEATFAVQMFGGF